MFTPLGFSGLLLGLPGYGGGGAEPEADVIRVRRSSDSTESDFNLTEWDDGTLDTFVGAGDGCLAEWKDSSGNDNDVIQSTTTLQPKVAVSGVVQEGVVFDGTDDYLTKGARLTSGSPTALTVAAFVKFTGTDGRCFASEYTGATTQRSWAMTHANVSTGWATTGKLSVWLSADGGSSNIKTYSGATTINDGAWHHVAFTFSSGTLLLYVDGVAETLTKHNDGPVTTLHPSTAALLIGSLNAGAYNFNGSIDRVGVWNSALTAGNIATLAVGGEVGSPLLWLKGNYTP